MKIPTPFRRNHGLTLFETLIVAFSLVTIAAVLLPAVNSSHAKGPKIHCTNNIKQIGLAFRIWEGDNGDHYPMAVAVTNGGAMEAILAGNPMRAFQVMSNELSTPIILVCPADTARQWATNFNSLLTAKNVSYFINPEAAESNPQAVMIGDDNLVVRGARVRSGLVTISASDPVAWGSDRHKHTGNLGLADGSAQSATDSGLKLYLTPTNTTSIRLAIP